MSVVLVKKPILWIFISLVVLLILALFIKPSTVSVVKNEEESSLYLNVTTCRKVSLSELDRWYESTKSEQIPKIIHQTWKTSNLRLKQAKWSQTWCDQYKDWRFHLWTDEENDKFVKTKFPWFYSTYQSLSPPILRADSIRYMYLYYYGGIYVDLDYESLQPVDSLFSGKTVVLSLINYSFDSMNSVPNSWMASKPHHPIWAYVLHRIMLIWSRTSDDEKKKFWNGKAEFFTGPQSMFEGLMFYLQLNRASKATLDGLFDGQTNKTPNAILTVNDVTFLGPKLMNAYDWMNGIGADVCSAEKPTFNEKKCQEKVKPIYAITYWSHSYGHGHESDSKYLS